MNNNNIVLCAFGCGCEANFKLKSGKLVCSEFSAQCPANRLKNSQKQKERHLDPTRQKYKFTPVDIAKSNEKRLKLAKEKAFIKNSTYSNDFIKKYFIEITGSYHCYDCGLYEWNNKFISLDLDHINGNNRDNRFENLRLLCPNCHAQTDTYRGKNINSGLIKVSDEDLIHALNKSKTIRQALMLVSLTPKGANYERAQKLLLKIKNNSN